MFLAIALQVVFSLAWSGEQGCGDLSGTKWSEIHDNEGQPPMVLTKAVPNEPAEAHYQTTDNLAHADAFTFKGSYDGTDLNVAAPSYADDGKPNGTTTWNLKLSPDCFKLSGPSHGGRANDVLQFSRLQMDLPEAVHEMLKALKNGEGKNISSLSVDQRKSQLAWWTGVILPLAYADETNKFWDTVVAASKNDPRRLATILYDELADPEYSQQVIALLNLDWAIVYNNLNANLPRFSTDDKYARLIRYWSAKKRWKERKIEIVSEQFVLLTKFAFIGMDEMAESVGLLPLAHLGNLSELISFLQTDKETRLDLGPKLTEKAVDAMNEAHVHNESSKALGNLAIKITAKAYEAASEKRSDAERLDQLVTQLDEMKDQQQALMQIDHEASTAITRQQAMAVAIAAQIAQEQSAIEQSQAATKATNGFTETVRDLANRLTGGFVAEPPGGDLPRLKAELTESSLRAGLLYYYSGRKVEAPAEAR